MDVSVQRYLTRTTRPEVQQLHLEYAFQSDGVRPRCLDTHDKVTPARRKQKSNSTVDFIARRILNTLFTTTPHYDQIR